MSEFYKVSGAGNDFIVLVEPADDPDTQTIFNLCRRGLSIGADGLFTLRRQGKHGVRMVYYNGDGARSDLCLNGCRCAAQLGFHLGWGSPSATLKVATDTGQIETRQLTPDRIELQLPPMIKPHRALRLVLGGKVFTGWRIQVGGIHFVLPWDNNLSGAPVRELGPLLRYHPELAPKGANIHFVRFPSQHRFEIRSYERGVENETLACGSGIIATAAVGVLESRLELPCVCLTSGGFELEIAGRRVKNGLNAVKLSGDARIVAQGRLLPEAQNLPPQPRWTSDDPSA